MKIAENISWKTLQDKVVAVNVTSGVYYTMNAVASDIWQAVARGVDEAALLEYLQGEYEGVDPSQLAADLKEQLEQWRSEKLLE